MEAIKEWLLSPDGLKWFSSAVVVLLSFICVICRLIASRCKNEKMKQLILLLPEAMEYAEQAGGSSEKKLNTCVSYIKDKIPKLTTSIITSAVEGGITISKTINSRYDPVKDTKKYSSTSRMP